VKLSVVINTDNSTTHSQNNLTIYLSKHLYMFTYNTLYYGLSKPTAAHAVNHLLKMGKERPKHVELPK
jgi:tryptophan-rich sensory protein